MSLTVQVERQKNKVYNALMHVPLAVLKELGALCEKRMLAVEEAQGLCEDRVQKDGSDSDGRSDADSRMQEVLVAHVSYNFASLSACFSCIVPLFPLWHPLSTMTLQWTGLSYPKPSQSPGPSTVITCGRRGC